MPVPSRTRIQREDQRRLVAQWYLQCVTQSEIAKRLGLSQQMISYDLKVIRARWNEDTRIRLDAAKMRELAKLDELEHIYWEGYRKSQEPRKVTTTERMAVSGSEPRTLARIEVVEREGNPVFLAGVERCVEARRKLLGLDAPTRVEGSGPGGAIPIMPVRVSAQIVAEAAKILEEVEYKVLPETIPEGPSGAA